jgi:hypothetical protein
MNQLKEESLNLYLLDQIEEINSCAVKDATRMWYDKDGRGNFLDFVEDFMVNYWYIFCMRN